MEKHGLAYPPELNVHLKLRFATVQTPGLAEARSVIFLQDVTEIDCAGTATETGVDGPT